MIKRLFNFKIVAIVALAALLIGGVAGSGFTYKWFQAAEADRLEVALEIAEQERKAALASLKTYYENKPPVEVIKTEVEYVIKKIPYSPECDVTPDEQRMLDYTRTGVRITARGTDASPGESGPTGSDRRVPRGAEVRAHADAAVKYRQCLATAKAVSQYLKARAN